MVECVLGVGAINTCLQEKYDKSQRRPPQTSNYHKTVSLFFFFLRNVCKKLLLEVRLHVVYRGRVVGPT